MSSSDPVASELAEVKIEGMTRSAFILRGALAAGAVYGGAVVGPFVSKSLAQVEGGEGDVTILDLALTLEALQQTFYEHGLRRVNGFRRNVRALIEELEVQEADHVAGVRRLLRDLGAGRGSAKATQFFFGDAFKDEGSFLRAAQDLEEMSVAAYNGMGPEIESPDVLAAAGSIVQVEGRHGSLIRLVRKEGPALAAFDPAIELEEVREFIEPFVVADRDGGGSNGR